MILVDTSVWVRHFRMGDKRLAELLEAGEVACHPDIVGELACGNLKRRTMVLSLLRELPVVPVAEDEEVLALLDREKLYGRGLGWIDAHLLASALVGRVRLWTADGPLRAIADELEIAYHVNDSGSA